MSTAILPKVSKIIELLRTAAKPPIFSDKTNPTSHSFPMSCFHCEFCPESPSLNFRTYAGFPEKGGNREQKLVIMVMIGDDDDFADPRIILSSYTRSKKASCFSFTLVDSVAQWFGRRRLAGRFTLPCTRSMVHR